MQANPPDSGMNAVSKPNLVSPFRWLTLFTTLLVLLQAVLAGQGLFDDPDMFDIHEMVANVIFLAVLVQLILTWLLRIQGPLGKQLLIMNGILLILTIVQIALGYQESAQATAWHIPNGVLLFGLAGATHSVARQLRGNA